MAAARVLDLRCLLVALLGGDAGLRGGERRGALTDGGPAWTVADEHINPWTRVAGTDGLLYWASKGELLGAGSIQRIDLMGGPIEALITGLNVPWDLAIDPRTGVPREQHSELRGIPGQSSAPRSD